MSSNFPSGPDTITNNVDNTTPEFNIHPPLHNQLADSVMAVQTSLLAGGSLSLADHKTAADPHPVYLTQAEGDARYTFIGGGITIPLSQNLTFAPDATYDIGASGANRPRNLFLSSTLYTGSDAVVGGHLWVDVLSGNTGSIIEQRSGTNAQTLNVYNTYTNASNYSRTSITDLGDLYILKENAGTGPAGAMNLWNRCNSVIEFATSNISRWQISSGGYLLAKIDNAYDIGGPSSQRPRNVYVASNVLAGGYVATNQVGTLTNAPLFLLTNTTNRWQIDAAGHFFASTDATYDIGASGANRPRSVYHAGGIYTAMNTAAQGPAIYGGSGVPAAGLGANGDVFHRSDTPATSLQRIYVKSAGAWVGIV